MPNFKTAEEMVAYRVFTQRLDSPVRTWFEVVDRFEITDKIVGEYDDEAEANAACDAIRAQRTEQVRRNPARYRREV